MALNKGTSSDRMDVVLNDYLDGSMKSAQQENRGEGSGSRFHNLQVDQKVKQWRKFLYSAVNGTSRIMIVFVTKEWPKVKYAEKDGRRSCSPVTGRSLPIFIQSLGGTSD